MLRHMEGISYLRSPGDRVRAATASRMDGQDAQVLAFPVRRAHDAQSPAASRRATASEHVVTSRRTAAPEQCMAELLAMLAEDGADVVAFARAVPTRFRGRLPAELRRAAGLAVPAEGW